MIDVDSLTYIPKAKFLRQRSIMLIADCPLEQEVKKKAAFSSQSAASMFNELNKVGVQRLHIHTSYLFNFRPEKADLNALFHITGLPVSEYTFWPQSKKDSILNFAYNDLINLREEIKEVNPSLIICTGRWALYFLTGETTLADTRKSPWGTLTKWRGSHLQLGSFWEYTDPHVVLPIYPPTAAFQLPEQSVVIRQDYIRAGILSKAAVQGNIRDYVEHLQDVTYITSPTFKQVKDWLTRELLCLEQGEKEYAVDVETVAGFHDCIGIASSSTECICIPWATMKSSAYWSEAEEVELIYLLHTFLSHPNCKHIGQNYTYDIQYEWRDLLVNAYPAFDTMVAQHAMFAGLEKKLAFLSSLYSKIHRYWKDEGKRTASSTDEQRWVYNCKDCCRTYEIAQVQKRMLSASPQNIQNVFKTQCYETLPTIVRIMRRGLNTDTFTKNALYKELVHAMEELRKELDYIVGEPFNPLSPDQKKALFYDLFDLPTQYDPKTKQPTLGSQALINLSEQFPLIRPFAERCSEYGNLKTFSSTFLKAATDIDGMMRTSYNVCGTDTYRLSSSEDAFGTGLNLQNIPKGGKTVTGRILPNCRALFIPPPDHDFFDIDLDSADLRIVVAESGASGLQEMLDAGLKPYVEMMKEYYNDPTKSKYSDEYRIFKGFAHGTHYLGSAAGLAARLGLLVHEIDKLQKWYFGRNPEIAKWHKELKSQVLNRGWIENVFGYRRYFWNKKEPTIMQIAAAWKPQSTVGLLINKGAVALDKYEPDVQVRLQVHDSLAGTFPTAKSYLPDVIKSRCEIPLPYEVPIIIPVDIKTSSVSWGACG
jgi:DNA polymerase-1